MYPPSIPQNSRKQAKNALFPLLGRHKKKPAKAPKSVHLAGLFIWSERQDLNLRPLPPQGRIFDYLTGALLKLLQVCCSLIFDVVYSKQGVY